MRLLGFAILAAALAAPAAQAKGNITVRLGDSTPAAGESFTVYVHTGYAVPANDWLRLVAVAPGKGWQSVVSAVEGYPTRPAANLPRDGFAAKLVRTGTYTWRAVVTLPRPGRWRLVVPNGTHAGYMLPPPAAWMPWVHVHG
ncbi:MAG TPA: hypothetical protein VFB25_04235 [Gaiellaceae bacterium]|nr:hypothetical protein [Gaiellaceae bacterium]